MRISNRQIVAISLGASISGHRGWGGYSISKAALNMMVKLYAHEMPDTHICSLAPGIFDTALQEYLCTSVDSEKFFSIRSLQDARNRSEMPSAEEAAKKIIEAIPGFFNHASGSYLDIRKV